MRIETLTRMGQQIARNYAGIPADEAVERIAAHLRSFWTPDMIGELCAYAAFSPDTLDPTLVAALDRLRADAPA